MPDAIKIIRTFWQALKLLGLILLIALIIAAIYFQTPWKVTGLLLVILLANVLIPKGKKRWFWFAAGVIVIALIIWVLLPDSGQWKSYAFDKELAALEAKYKIPDEQNAALIYQPLLEHYQNILLEPNLPDPNVYWRIAWHQPWRSRDYPGLAKWIEDQKQTIDTLLEASRKENCHFPISRDFNDMQRLVKMRGFGFLLVSAANNDTAENRIEQAAEKYTAALQIAKHQLQQTTVMDFMVGMAIKAYVMVNIDRFVVEDNVSETELNRFEQMCASIKYNWPGNWPKILENEKLLFKNLLTNMAYEINTKGKVRYTQRMSRISCCGKGLCRPGYLQKKLAKAQAILLWLYVPSNPTELARRIDRAYAEIPDQTQQRFVKKPFWKYKLNYQTVIEAMVPLQGRTEASLSLLYERTLMRQRGCELILGLRQYKNKMGHWPKNLDEIKDSVPAETFTDPLNNSAFVYKLTAENFTLYSKGKNGIDENGRNGRGTKGKPGPDDWLIWPQSQHK